MNKRKRNVILSVGLFSLLLVNISLTFSIYDPLPMMPTIDFTSYTVIATSLGEKLITGYEITITQIIEYSTNIKKFIEIKEPPFVNDPGPVQPYHIVKLEKISKPVTFHIISTTPENNDYMPENRESEFMIIFSLVGGNFGLILFAIFYVIIKEKKLREINS